MNLRRVVVVTTTRHDDTAPRSFAAVSHSHNFTPSHYNIRRELSFFTLYLIDCSTFCFLYNAAVYLYHKHNHKSNQQLWLAVSLPSSPSLLPYSPVSSSSSLLSRSAPSLAFLPGWFTQPDLSELHAQALLDFNFKLCRARVFRTETKKNIAGYPYFDCSA